jgi:hypothetical protein
MNNSESQRHDNASEPSRIEGLASEYFRAATDADQAGAGNDARRVRLLDELASAPAITARDFATKIIAHARLLGIEDGGDCMSVIEASLIRDARALLSVPAA